MSTLSDRLIAFNKHLLPNMVQLKYKAIAADAFSFYRGTCHLFYEDLSNAPALPLSPITWICGDLHLENYGSFKGDNKMVYFDINDFDEGLLAPVAYELTRMVTSILIAFDTLGIEQKKAVKMAELFLKTYSSTLSHGKAVSFDPRTAKGIVCDFLRAAEKSKEKDILKKLTDTRKNRIDLALEGEKQLKLEKELRKELAAHIDEWIAGSCDARYEYKVKDAAFRVAGTGSLGQKRYLMLLKSSNTKNKYLLVDMKQAMAPSPRPYVKVQQLAWETEAHRIIAIQKRMQNVSASLLGTTVFKGDAYVVQELQPVKDAIKLDLFKDDYDNIYQVIEDMATITASAQLRSGGIQGSAIIDDLMVFGKSDEWQPAILEYAKKYAKTVKSDHEQFVKDYKNGVFGKPEEGS